MKTILSEDRVRRLAGRAGARRDVWDATVPGLHVRVTKTARGLVRKTWYLVYRHGGSRRVWRLGDWPTVGVDEAQERARRARELVARGVDPRAEEDRQVREEERRRREEEAQRLRAERRTFTSLAAAYCRHRRRQGWRRASIREEIRQLRKDVVPLIGAVPAGEVTPDDVDRVLARILKRGAKRMANRTRALLFSIFRFGCRDREWQRLLDGNPVEATERPLREEPPRDRVLSDDELRRLWLAAEPAENGRSDLAAGVLHPVVGAAFRLRLLTGQRWTEVVAARWQHVGTERVEIDGRQVDVPLWTIPRAATKTRRSLHVVPLSAQVVAVLEALRPLTGETGWLFPGRSGGHLGRVNRSFRAWAERAGVEDFIGKDIRRSVVTGLSRLGVDLEVRAAVANHTIRGVTKSVYDRYGFLPQKRAALDKWGRHIERLVTGEVATVVAIGGAS